MAFRCFSLISLLAGASLAAGVAIAAENAAPAKAPDQTAAQDSQKAAAGDAKAPAAPAGQATEGKDAATAAAAPQTDQKAAGGASGGGTPKATAEAAEKGSLKSAISGGAADGHKVYMAAGCNGCHGGSGGGGMGPPLTNQVWIYGSDDDTLFRLVALGSDALQKQGYKRKGSESVVGPMPPHGEIVKSDEDLWKIIAWIREINPSSGKASATTASGGSAPPPQ